MSIASEITRIQGAKADLKTAINAKTDAQHKITTETIDDYADFVDSISTGSDKPEQSKTTNPSTSQVVVTPDTGYTLSSVTVNAMPIGALSAPTINTSTGLITTSVRSSGYISSGTATTLQLSTQSSQTITPTTTNQTISSGKYLIGTQTISGDANLVAGNIKKDVTIFGVTGTHEGGGSGTLITKSITQNGTYNASDDSADGYSQVTVNVSGGGTIEPEEKDVNFYDYDGTRVYSYTKAEFLALSEPPNLPTHEGLTENGWNYYNFDRAKQYVERDGFLDIGALYKTTSGGTEIIINLTEEFKTPYIFVGATKNCTIDWGDETARQTVTPSGGWINPSHEYAHGGKYKITITQLNNTYLTLKCTGQTSAYNDNEKVGTLLWGGSSSDSQQTNLIYANCIEEIRLGNKVLLDTTGRCFSGFGNLKAITGFTKTNSDLLNIEDYLFLNCKKLKAIIFPPIFSLIKNHVFKNCYSLQYCLFSTSRWALSQNETTSNVFENCSSLRKFNMNFNNSSLSTIENVKINLSKTSYLFKNCYLLSYVYLPLVSAIGSDTFSGDYKHIKVFDFTESDAVPTLGGTSAFSAGTSDYEIWVPSSLYNDWITASNWSSISSHIVSK